MTGEDVERKEGKGDRGENERGREGGDSGGRREQMDGRRGLIIHSRKEGMGYIL